MKKILCLLYALLCCTELYSKNVAILGDSITAGAFIDERLELRVDSLLEVMKNPKDKKPALEAEKNNLVIERSTLSKRQQAFDSTWLFRYVWMKFVSVFLEYPELSWSSKLAATSENDQVLHLAAGNGDRIGASIDQLSSVFSKTDYIMPDETYMFFTGLDLCALSPEYVVSPEQYGRNLERFTNYLKINAKETKGKKLFVVSPLNILQLVSSEKILNSQKNLNGEMKSCKYLQTNSFRLETDSKELEANFLQNSISSLQTFVQLYFLFISIRIEN